MLALLAIALIAAAPSPGLDLAGMDRSLRPGDDFYGYANGAWMKATEIPPDQTAWGPENVLEEEARQHTRELLEAGGREDAGVGPNERKACDYYAAFMNDGEIEKRGLSPLRAELDAVARITDTSALARALGGQLRADVDPLNDTNFHTENLFGLWVAPALSDPSKNAAYLLQGGVAMPDREYYLSSAAPMRDKRRKYLAYVTAMLKLAGVARADAKAARVVDLETRIARTHAPRVDSEDVLKANNPWRRAEFGKQAPGLDWPAFFAAAGLDHEDTLIVWHPSAVRGIAALADHAPLDDWKDLLTFHLLDHFSRWLPKAFVEEAFQFHGRTLSGQPVLQDRWKRGVTATDAALGQAVGKMYVQRYFAPESKATVQTIVKKLIGAFAKRIDRLDWMAPQTRARAKAKLDTLYVGIGYPETWIDYSALEIRRDDAVGNQQRAELFEYRRSLAKLSRAPDVREWAMVPQVVNAVNLPLQNALNFPAAILQPPYFDPAADAAFNYGAIGATIGHEVSHSFDDQGSLFDEHGKLSNWWSNADLKHFRSSAEALAKEFDAYRPLPDLSVNGHLTLSENIADLAGLSAAHDAWLESVGGKPPPAPGGMTAEQEFFLSYAQSWREKERDEALRRRLLTDGHAPARYRADTVRNLDAWYPAFGVAPGQALYLTPEQRVRVW